MNLLQREMEFKMDQTSF